MPTLDTRHALALATLGFALPALAQGSVGGVSFVDRAASGQITLGNIRGSIGVIDYDNDGWYDLYLGEEAGKPMRLFHNVASPGAPGGRSFQDVSTSSGIGTDADATSHGFSGVVIFDYNNDNFSDIYMPVPAGTDHAGLLLRNNGNGTFTNVSVASGTRIHNVFPLCASATDFDHDGNTDLVIASTNTPGFMLTLLRNNGNGTFSPRPDLLPTTTFGGVTYAMGFMDYDHDGWDDGFILFNNGAPLMLRNVPNPSGGRKFVDATASSGFTFVGPAPMGIAFGDVNNDGALDVAITDSVRGTYYQSQNDTLVRITPYNTFFGWGTTYLDAENDGDLDNYQAGSAPNANIDWLLRNDGAAGFIDARAGLNTPARSSQYCARIDFDNDGREDIVTVNPATFVSIYHNQSVSAMAGATNHWFRTKLRGTGAVNADAVGALVRLTAAGKTQVRQIALGTAYAASEDPRAHFGIGEASTVSTIEVIWPRQGTLAERTDIFSGPFDADQTIELQPRTCAADRNGDQIIDLSDFFSFFNCFDAAAPCAEVDGTTGIDLGDFFTFLNAFDANC